MNQWVLSRVLILVILKLMDIDGYSPGKSLNYGVTKCSNDYILILSAHSQIMNCEFEKIKSLLDEVLCGWWKTNTNI